MRLDDRRERMDRYRAFLRSQQPLAIALVGMGISPERVIDLLVVRPARIH